MTNPFFKYRSSEVDNDLRLTVLSSSFIPDSFPHRSEQIDQMVKILSSVMRNSSPSNLLLYGKSGTGKTSVAKKVSNLLKEAFPEKVKVIYINCQLNDSTYSVLVNAANSIIVNENEKIPLSGWTVERIYNELLRQLEKIGGFIVLILDEIDKLARKNDGDSLYVILKLADDAKSSRLSFIGITNYTSFLETLDARVRSRLNQESIVFPSYNASQLRDILQERVSLTGMRNMVDDSAISLCAAIGAREHGDARKAIDLMRISIEIGIRDFMERIGEENVYKARDKYEMNILRESINGLPLHSKILLLSAVVTQDQDRDNMITGEIYENYKKICDELSVQSLTSRRIGDLLSELDDLGLIITVTKSLGRYGRTRIITVPDYDDLMKKYLLEDEILSTFKGIKIGKQHRLKMDTDESQSRPVKEDEMSDIISSKKE
jgi:cell division control protein 6